jgi:adrenodoxin-NADP+ reductase
MCLATGVGSPDLDPGLYVCGWVKRGPTGIIGTNLTDAEETVACLVADRDALLKAAAGPAGPGGWQQLEPLLQQRGVQVVDWGGWGKIDAAEVAAGQQLGKVREKMAEVPDMLNAAAAAAVG